MRRSIAKHILYEWGFFAICASLCLVVFSIAVRNPGINSYRRSMVVDMVYGQAYRPFVYRTLLPTSVRLATGLMPQAARTSLAGWLGSNPSANRWFTRLGWEKAYAVEYALTLTLMYGSLVGFVYALRYLFGGVFVAPSRFLDLVALAAAAALPGFYKYYTYVYDFTTLLLFTLALGLMARNRGVAYLVVFALACLNKETAILLTLVFAIHFAEEVRTRRRAYWGLLLAQAVVFAAIRVALLDLFRNNPGDIVEFHLLDHNLGALAPYPFSSVIAAGLVALAIFYRWREQPAFARHGTWVLVPLLALGLLFGYVDELRGYYEAYPIVLILLASTAARLVGIELGSCQAVLQDVPARSVEQTQGIAT